MGSAPNLGILIEDLVAAVAQAVFDDAASFLVGGANALRAAGYGANSGALGRITGNRADQSTDDCTTGVCTAGLGTDNTTCSAPCASGYCEDGYICINVEGASEEIAVSENTVSGNRWNVRKKGQIYILEYDSGELVEKFNEIEIAEEDFNLIKEGKVDIKFLRNKYLLSE